MKETETASYTRELYTAIAATIAMVGTIVGLVADIPQVSNSLLGKAILLAILFIAVGYLAWFIFTKFLRAYLELRARLQEIKDLLVDFTSKHANSLLEGSIDIEQIKLVSTTKWAKRLPIRVRGLQPLPDGKVKIIIDRGSQDGLTDTMHFKVLHNSRFHELGSCSCTTFHDQTALVIDLPPDCPIALNDITKETVEVRLIDPEVSNKVTLLIGNLLYKVDYG